MSRRSWLLLISAAAALRLLLATFVTDFVLVDDAYITLRYARNAAESGALIYNHGEAVFGITSPLWGFVTSGLMVAVGPAHIAVAVLVLGVVLWSLAAVRLVELVQAPARGLTLAVFLCAPVFVDNQMLGMETPLFVFLAIQAIGAALDGTLRPAAFWTALLVVARPEGVLFAPALLAHVVTAAIVGAVAWVSWRNLTRGTTFSRAWLLVYVVYMTFYLTGKGATEASWYAVPSSVALLLASGPAIPASFTRHRAGLATAGAGTLMLLSIGLVQKRAPLLHSYVDGYGACARALEALDRPHSERGLIGEIGVFGFETAHQVIDVGALVSPEVLAIKNAHWSLLAMARETGASWLVISDIALERNDYPSVGAVWADEEERAWLESSQVALHARDKRLIKLADRQGTAAAQGP